MDKRIKITAIFLVFLMVMGIILATLIMGIIRKNKECLENPFVFGARNSQEKGIELICSCSSPNTPGFQDFYFDNESIYLVKPSGLYDLNISLEKG